MTEKPISKKKIQGLKTKKRIYETAMKLFLEKGYTNVTVDKIIEEANSSKGAFYTHFKSKANILDESINLLDVKYKEYYEEILKKSKLDSLTKIKEFTLFVQKTLINHLPRELFAQLLSYSLISDFEINIKMTKERQYYKILESIINLGKEANEINELIDTEQIIRWLVAIHRGVNHNYCIQEKTLDYLKLVEELVDLVILKIRK